MTTPSIVSRQGYEIIDSAELARRLTVPTSWVRDQVRSRAVDPIPHIQFGRYVRFEWGHPALMEWLERHRSHYQHKNGRQFTPAR